jgi:predicted esterase
LKIIAPTSSVPCRRFACQASPEAKPMPQDDLGFVHKFVATDPEVPNPVTLLLLHGTGGSETDLLPLGHALWPGAALLSPRGRVLENGMPRYFRRLAEGVFDVEDLKVRTDELAEFITAAAKWYRVSAAHLVAVGYSNGANIAASLPLRHPRLLRAAVLFRPMVPYEPAAIPDLSEVSLLLARALAIQSFPLTSQGDGWRSSTAVAPASLCFGMQAATNSARTNWRQPTLGSPTAG